ncbi:UNVERIFIED_CONTAM: Retrovirus-related Pol polyprotein from type-2 retrotransposable element R2DM [Sesamum calycinum]|uniref:Retrovirus-related Pol polyprotein from type-2 retrotransposable element R2DM n=1 Tax=Sesamum calycinum TaxID=2727403 RepID=A0AAW2IYY7_9LAMI
MHVFQINDDAGHTITNSDEVVAEFIAFYEQLLGGTRNSRTLDLTQYRPWASRILSHEDGVKLTCPVSVEEIKLAFFDIAKDKSPGPDGYTTTFYKAAWPVVGDEITRAIMDFFTNGRLLKQVNATLLVLIPKVQFPLFVSDFRPISCCNVLSVITGYNQQNLPKHCALMVDLRKAYDTVEWDFLFASMRLFGFPEVFIQWVEECVTTPTFSVCINGSAHGFFKGARGLRPRDPMPPYLFVLVMEVLRMILQQMIEQETTFRYHWHCAELSLFQLGFADDLLLFCEVHEPSIVVFQRGLELFATLSRLHVNPTKSQLILSKAARYDNTRFLATLGFQKGQLQLIKSILMALNTYWAIAFILPKGIIKEIEKRLRNFLWKGVARTGYSKVAWSQVCNPVDERGLRVRDFQSLNHALMSRRLWEVIQRNPSSLWVQFIYRIRLRNKSVWTASLTVGHGDGGKSFDYETRCYQTLSIILGVTLIALIGG